MSKTSNYLNRNFNPCTSSWVTYYFPADFDGEKPNNNDDSYAPKITFMNFTFGDMMNQYEDLVLKAKWDVRENSNSPSIVVARNHMFVEKAVESPNYKNKYYNNISNEVVQNFPWRNPIEIIKKVLSLENDLSINNDETRNEKLEMFDILNRINIRKFSETHFAISSYNLIGYNIETNNDIPSLISADLVKEVKSNRSVSILEQKTVDYLSKTKDDTKFVETKCILPIKELEPKGEQYNNLKQTGEYLSNKLIDELEYMHQGKIFILFNDDIEIGDRIVLMDNITGTYGVFEIDAFEHTFDERGLITCLFVKTCIDIVDPTLDTYAINMNYELIKNYKDAVLKNYGKEISRNVKLKNIYGIYTKVMLQNPKYANLTHLKKDSLFTNAEKLWRPFLDIPLLIRYLPYVKKGKSMMPSCLNYAFFEKYGKYNNFLTEFINKIKASFNEFVEDAYDSFVSILIFSLDTILGMVSMGISDLLKPIIGYTTYSAEKHLENKDANRLNELYTEQYSHSYNPYDGSYSINESNSYNLIIGFFNVQAQKPSNLFPVKNPTFTHEQFLAKNEIKTKTIQKLMQEAFDCTLLVEMYDSYTSGDYTIENFATDITPAKNSFYSKSKVYENSKGIEYGYSYFNNRYKYISQMIIPLKNGRSAIETTFDVSKYKLKNDKQDPITILKVVWFHNIYGETQLTDQNKLQERIDNVKLLLKKYEEEMRKNPHYAVAIMADFNLTIYNHSVKRTTATDKNASYQIPSDSIFVAMIEDPTTFNKEGELKSNCYDNILIPKFLKDYVHCRRYVYSMDEDKDKLTVSDHIPIYLAIKKQY